MQQPLSVGELIEQGLDQSEAAQFAGRLGELWAEADPVVRWRRISQELLSSAIPFDVHYALFQRNYADHQATIPAPAWTPDPSDIERANLTSIMRALGHQEVAEFAGWAGADAGRFWGLMVERLGVRFVQRPECILDLSDGIEQPRWLPGARLNIAESCFQHPQAAVLAADETGRERRVGIPELADLTARFAGALAGQGVGSGDAVALVLPLSIEAVAAFLGTIWAGATAVCIAESFAPAEIVRRAQIGRAKLVVTQDGLLRGGKRLALYEKLQAVDLPPMIVTRSAAGPGINLRDEDIWWDDFLAGGQPMVEPVACRADDVTSLLFSSGTTADPKAIPWTHTTPIKCAADGFLYQDIHADDAVAWPTGMGWMMGPWLVYAGLINGATVALFDGHAATPAFAKFVARAGVTVLGVIPSLVAAWKTTGLWDEADWRGIRLFSSTGECSQPEHMLALSSRAGYRPVIEYCGGTELGGGYIATSVLRPWAPSHFNQPVIGLTLSLFDDEGQPSDRGEVFLAGPAMGLSTTLLGGDHHETYYADTPKDSEGRPLRRHGDSLEALGDGWYRILGRADDAMNLGGIKVSAVELERVLNQHPAVSETAAVAVAAPSGGPARLVVFAVPGGDSNGEPMKPSTLRSELQQLIRQELNPLFQISEADWIDALPRTASNKVMRRHLRERAQPDAEQGERGT
jgi:acetyl-CoA synthetase